jgi:hypothetical protein
MGPGGRGRELHTCGCTHCARCADLGLCQLGWSITRPHTGEMLRCSGIRATGPVFALRTITHISRASRKRALFEVAAKMAAQ